MNKRKLKSFVVQGLRVLKAVNHADISIHSGLMLAILDRDGKMQIGELAEKVKITQQAVGRALKVLELHDEVTVTRDRGDMRAKNAEITPKGVNSLEFVVEGMG